MSVAKVQCWRLEGEQWVPLSHAACWLDIFVVRVEDPRLPRSRASSSDDAATMVRERIDMIDVVNGTLEYSSTLKAGACLEAHDADVERDFYVLRPSGGGEVIGLRFANSEQDPAALSKALAHVLCEETGASRSRRPAAPPARHRRQALRDSLHETGFGVADVDRAMAALGDSITKIDAINWIFDNVVHDQPTIPPASPPSSPKLRLPPKPRFAVPVIAVITAERRALFAANVPTVAQASLIDWPQQEDSKEDDDAIQLQVAASKRISALASLRETLGEDGFTDEELLSHLAAHDQDLELTTATLIETLLRRNKEQAKNDEKKYPAATRMLRAGATVVAAPPPPAPLMVEQRQATTPPRKSGWSAFENLRARWQRSPTKEGGSSWKGGLAFSSAGKRKPPSRQSSDEPSACSPSNGVRSPSKGLDDAARSAVDRLKDSSTLPMSPGEFEPLRLVGRGATSQVLLVRRVATKKLYAMKVMEKKHLCHAGMKDLAKFEREVLKVMKHPYLVRLRYAFQTDHRLYMVTTYYEAGSLDQIIHWDEERRRPLGLGVNAARFIVAELTLALEHLHERNVLHRDIKAANVLLDAQGHAHLGDFGLSKRQPEEIFGGITEGAVDDSSPTTTSQRSRFLGGLNKGAGKKKKQRSASQPAASTTTKPPRRHREESFVGTPSYMAPELLLKASERNPRASDWWALGVLLVEIVQGLKPFEADSGRQLFINILRKPPSFDPGTPKDLLDVATALLDKDPMTRAGFKATVRAPFFSKHVDWTQLRKRNVAPPFRPHLPENLDDLTADPSLEHLLAVAEEDNTGQTGRASFDDFDYRQSHDWRQSTPSSRNNVT